MIIQKTITIDFNSSEGTIAQVHAVQGDCYTRSLIAKLFCDNVPWTPPDSTICAVRYLKPDGTQGSYDTMPSGEEAWNLAGNSLTISLAPQMFTCPGCVNAQIMLINNDSILSSFTFQIIVTKDPSLTSICSADYFNWQHWLKAQLDQVLEEAIHSEELIGQTPNLTIGNVTTLPAGSDATVTLRGTRETPIIDIGLPQGDPGVSSPLAIYPIGSIYLSVLQTSPSALFGGTWEQLKDKFLLAAGDSYAAATTGGEAAHTLTTQQLPTHRHAQTINVDGLGSLMFDGSEDVNGWTSNFSHGDNLKVRVLGDTVKGVSTSLAQTTAGEGSGQAHNNMPPYLAVYMWKRIA